MKIKVHVLPHASYCPAGATYEAQSGQTICESLLANGLLIEHACDMSCACTTCHVIVKKGFDSLNAIDESEDDLLDKAWGLSQRSRLSCQAIIGQEDLEIEIPLYSINQKS